jgi:hypothetical protein
MKEKLDGFVDTKTPVKTLADEFFREGALEIGKNHELKLAKVDGGFQVNGAFIRSADALRVIMYLAH